MSLIAIRVARSVFRSKGGVGGATWIKHYPTTTGKIESSSKTIVPFHEHVPYDIMVIIISHMDRSTLRAVSFVNQDFHREASRILWHTFTISAPVNLRGVRLLNHLRQRCEVLLRADRDNAGQIRKLILDFDRLKPSSQDDAVHHTSNITSTHVSSLMDLGSQLLLSLPHITHLALRAPLVDASHVESLLSAVPQATSRIAALDLDCSSTTNLAPFFATQPYIHRLSLSGPYTPNQDTSIHLSNLRTLRASATTITGLAHLHSLQRVEITSSIDQRLATTVIQSLAGSASSLIHFTFTHAVSPAGPILSSFAKAFPRIRTLSIHNTLDEVEMDGHMAASAWRDLEEFMCLSFVPFPHPPLPDVFIGGDDEGKGRVRWIREIASSPTGQREIWRRARLRYLDGSGPGFVHHKD